MKTTDPVKRARGEVPGTILTATDDLLTSFAQRRSRRALLKTAAIGATGAALASATALTALPVHAESVRASDSFQTIANIAATAEALAVTFYTNGIAHNNRLKIPANNLVYLKAAVVEEQIHYNFLVSLGANPLATTFSFPCGMDTFEHLNTFIATLQQLEEAFIAAYLAAVGEFASMGSPSTAQIAAQIACVEGEHRVLGRDILGASPANNVAFEPILLKTVGQAPGVLASEGYLSPKGQNSFAYHAAASTFPGLIDRAPGDTQVAPPPQC